LLPEMKTFLHQTVFSWDISLCEMTSFNDFLFPSERDPFHLYSQFPGLSFLLLCDGVSPQIPPPVAIPRDSHALSSARNPLPLHKMDTLSATRLFLRLFSFFPCTLPLSDGRGSRRKMSSFSLNFPIGTSNVGPFGRLFSSLSLPQAARTRMGGLFPPHVFDFHPRFPIASDPPWVFPRMDTSPERTPLLPLSIQITPCLGAFSLNWL